MPKLTGCHRIEVRARKLRSFCDSSFGEKILDERANTPTSSDPFFFINIHGSIHTISPPWLCEPPDPPVYWTFYLDSGLALKGPNKLRDCGGLYAIASWLGLLRSPKIEMCIFEKLWKLKRDWRSVVINLIFLQFMTSLLQSLAVKKVYMVFSK